MIQKQFDQIGREDIESLVANKVKEGRTIEYKESLPGNADKDKKEFLADVSSFANAAGGDLLYGVVAERDAGGKTTGVLESVPGLPGLNADAEILRLDSMLQAGIGPRIAGVRIRTVEGFAGGPVLLLRVPKSYAAPHMVTFQEHSRFYSRNNGGKYPLDVTEIRSAFALSESLPEKVRRFRAERLARVVAGETPVGPMDGAKIVLHLVPLRSLDPVTQVDLAALEPVIDYEGPVA
jgi:predicted HTH transcriptional regulator